MRDRPSRWWLVAVLGIGLLLFAGVRLVDWALSSPGPGAGGAAQAAAGPAGGRHDGTRGRAHRGRLSRVPGGQGSRAEPGTDASGEAGAGAEAVPTTPLTVRVLGPEGPVPAPGATVYLDDRPMGVTDEKGEVTFPYPLDTERHDAWAERGEAKAEAFFLWGQNLPAGALTLVLRGSAPIRGVVLDRDGEVVAGAEVSLRPAAADPVVTGADGRFAFEGLPEGGYELTATADTRRARVWANVISGHAQEVSLTLEDRVRVAGVVVDEAGKGVSGVDVFVTAGSNESTRTDSDGRFELLVAPRGTVEVDVLGSKLHGRYLGPPREDIRIVVTRAESHLVVVATYSDGSPAEHRTFEVRGAPGNLGYGARCANEEAPGRYPCPPVDAGPWTIVEPTNFETPEPLATVHLDAGETREVHVVLRGADTTLRGHVLDARSGAPVAGADLQAASVPNIFGHAYLDDGLPSAVSDAEGAFALEHLRATERYLQVRAEGYVPRIVSLAPKDASPIEVRLEPARRIRGRVVDEKHLPLMEFFIDGEYVSDSSGSFDRSVTVETESITVSGFGRAPKTVELPSGEEDADLGDIVLSDMEATHFLVRGPKGLPVQAAVVTAVPIRGVPEPHISAGTDAAGRSQLVLPPGDYRFEADHPRYASSGFSKPRSISGGETIELRLQAGAWVVGDAGAPGTIVDVEAPVSSGGGHAVAGPDGHYRIGPVRGPLVSLSFTRPGPQGAGRTQITPFLVVREGEEVRFDVDDPARGRVRILCPHEQMLQIVLQAEHPGAMRATTTSYEGGAIEFVGLVPGAYHLQIIGDGIRQDTLMVEAGRTVERSVADVPQREP